MRSALFPALACLLVCTATASGKEVYSLSELSLKDEISLQDMIAAQNAEEAPLRIRRLMGIHLFRRIAQPTNPLPEWQKQLTGLRWLTQKCVSFFGGRDGWGGGFHPDSGEKTNTLVVVEVLPERDDLCLVYVGFDVVQERNADQEKEDVAFRFLTETKAKITYLGLCHTTGMMENYRDGKLWMSYHPYPQPSADQRLASPPKGQPPTKDP
jgi:hypothetical protein